MRKQSVRLLATVLLGAMLAVCAAPTATTSGPVTDAAQPTSDAAQPVATTGEKQTLDLWFNSDDTFNQFNEKVIADFEAANPDIDIVYSPYANEAYKTTLQVAIGSDDPPDILFNWAGDDTGRFAREGNLLDLSSYAKQYKWADSCLPQCSTPSL